MSTNSSRRWIAGVEPTAEVLAMNGTQVLEMECRQQPARLAELLEAYGQPAIQEQLQAMRAHAAEEAGPILVVGMGGSLCSGIAMAATLQAHGRAAFAVDAGEWLHFGLSTWGEMAYTVLLTTSGESAELVELLRRAGDGHRVGLICNNPASTCWRMATDRLPVLAGPEYGNATKTYTNSTAAGIILAHELLGLPWEADAGRMLQVFADALDPLFARRREFDRFCAGATNLELIGRGPAFGAVFMGALTIREMTGFRAAPHTGAGFKHGPNLDVDASHVALIAALGRAPELSYKLAAECLRRGGRVLLVSSEAVDALPEPLQAALAKPQPRVLAVQIDAVPEPWEALTTLLVPQALALALTERLGCRLPPRFAYGVMEQ